MKKTLFIIGLFLFTVIEVNAQEIANNTIGLRLGGRHYVVGPEISYQRKLSDTNRLEVNLAWRGNSDYNNIKLTALYQWVFDLEAADGMNWYVGAGGGLGSWKYRSSYNFTGDQGAYFFAAGVVGAEYKFEFPLLLSLDFRPEIGFVNFYSDLGVDIGISARYTFN